MELTNIEDTFSNHTCAETFGRKVCSSLTLWHALTGCDTVSSFSGKGKKTTWKVLRLFDEGLATFAKYLFIKYFTSPFRRKQLFVSIVLKVYLCSQAWLSAKPCA